MSGDRTPGAAELNWPRRGSRRLIYINQPTEKASGAGLCDLVRPQFPEKCQRSDGGREGFRFRPSIFSGRGPGTSPGCGCPDGEADRRERGSRKLTLGYVPRFSRGSARAGLIHIVGKFPLFRGDAKAYRSGPRYQWC